MVLVQLGGSMLGALQQMRNTTKIDEKVLNDCLKNITGALFDSGADVELLSDFKTNIKNKVKLDDLAAAEIIQQAVYDELCKMLDPAKPRFTPEKGKTSVVIFVGHSNQGSGITTTIAQYANYHKKKGYEPALVCADTFRDDAFDKLKRKANLAKIPFHGRNKESNGVRIAVEGVEKFKKTNCDLIIFETSVRQMQMRHVCEATKQRYADLVVCVMDGSIREAAFDVVLAFKQSVVVGVVILTNIDGHAKGGGTLTGVAAAKCPVIFIGTGALMDEFEVFDVEPFVGRLLGMDDLDEIQQVDQPNISLRQEKGKA